MSDVWSCLGGSFSFSSAHYGNLGIMSSPAVLYLTSEHPCTCQPLRLQHGGGMDP